MRMRLVVMCVTTFIVPDTLGSVTKEGEGRSKGTGKLHLTPTTSRLGEEYRCPAGLSGLPATYWALVASRDLSGPRPLSGARNNTIRSA